MIYHNPRPILYVDDTVEQRYAMRRILETHGFNVLEAGTGKEALELLAMEPALAVVDVRLPDVNGYDLTRTMKHRLPYLPVLQVSASFSDPELRAAGFSGGADGYIAQPVHPAELVAVLRRMLRAAEAENALRFLAALGPRFSTSLSSDETAENIRRAMVPYFADHCAIYLSSQYQQPVSFWPDSLDEDMRQQLIKGATTGSPKLIDSRLIIAPLTAGGVGSIGFSLGQEREYAAPDLMLASDLASRAALVLQNCALFSSAEKTRAALIQAEKLATAGRMAAAIAHEINNPLEALTNLLYILEQSPEMTITNRDVASAALVEVTRLAHITRQSLGFYRELRTPSQMDLSQSVADTLSLYQKRFDAKKVDVETALEEGVKLLGIKGEIRQVISNLLVNALEATPTGGRVLLETRVEDGRACMAISDTGGGVSPAMAEKIFEPFFTTKQGTGTGLGLWITQSIVQKHDGNIKLAANHGAAAEGTRFEIDFPLLPEAKNAGSSA
ncbi:MAG TPA: ATP-binding protein [Edaphobacter sp.]|nr:ATP-binding protein [Edaphobacter sp.]